MKKIAFFILFFSLSLFSLNVAATCIIDGSCDSSAGENKCTCPQDCGDCSGRVPNEACKEYYCITPITCGIKIIFNCCGNGLCEAKESFRTCDVDCAPKTVTVALMDFEDKEYLRGETVLLKANVLAEDLPAKKASVTASGFFGTIRLVDDGNHSDGKRNDGVYANSFTVATNVEKGDYSVEIKADKGGTIGTATQTIKINPKLDLEINLNKEEFALGDIIEISGSLERLGKPLIVEISIDFIFRNRKIFGTTVLPDSNGLFSLSRHTSLIDPAGVWTIEAKTEDVKKNLGLVQLDVNFSSPEKTAFFVVGFIEPVAKAFNRGRQINFLVKVRDSSNKAVSDALVEAVMPGEKRISLEEVSPGNYGGSFNIPFDFSLGEQQLTATVSKVIGETLYGGFASTTIFINKAPMTMEIIAPEKTIYNLGETIDFKLRLLYEFNIPVNNADIDLFAGEKKIRAKELGGGYYAASYSIAEDEAGPMVIRVEAKDEFENSAKEELNFEIKPVLPLTIFLTRNPVILAAVIVAVLFAAVVLFLFAKNILLLKILERKKEELVALKKKLQEQYFNEKTVESSEYYPLLDKYNEELEKLDVAIKALKAIK